MPETPEDLTALPSPAFAGGRRAITTTPIVGSPRRTYAEAFVPGEEELEDDELRVTVLGSGNPWVTRAQASASVLVEVGNTERDIFVIDLGSGSLANFASLKLPVNELDKVFLTHLHADHTADLITLFGSYRKSGRVDRGVGVWGPSGSEPQFGTERFVDAIREACKWDSESTRSIHAEESFELGARVRLLTDPGGVRGERRHDHILPGHPRAFGRGRLPVRLRRNDLRPLGRHPARMASRSRL
jgi:ribonuclease Z